MEIQSWNLKVSQTTWRRGWNALLDASRLSRYFTELSNRLVWADYFVKFILAASASGSVLSYVMEDWLPDPAGYGLTVMTAALAFWIMIYDYSAKIVVSREVRDQYQKLELTARRLWSDLADMDEAEARERINDLESEIQDYHSLPDKANVRYRKRLNKRCTQDVTELIKAEYG